MSDAELDSLMLRAREGDHEAALKIVNHWKPLLCRLIRGHLHPQLRRVIDAEDCFQSVLVDLVRKPCRDEIFSSQQRLLAFLKATVLHKLAALTRYNLDTLKRALSRDVPLPADLRQAGPSAEQLFDDAEHWHDRFAELKEVELLLLVKLCNGISAADAALELGISRSEACKIREKIRRLWVYVVLVENPVLS